MDSNHNFPLLSYVLHQLDPKSHPPLPPEAEESLIKRLPQLTNPEVISSLTQSIPVIITHTQTLFRSLGSRPDPESVSVARYKMTQMQEIGAFKEMEIYKALVRLEEMYEKLEGELSDVDQMLDRVYEKVVVEGGQDEFKRGGDDDDGVDEEVVRILKQSESDGDVQSVDLSKRQLKFLPEAFGKLHDLLAFNLSRNRLECIPDSVAGLHKLEMLDVSYNILTSLPDAIGLLTNLKVLDVSGNKLTALPESIARCSSLVELDASFNNLLCLPTNIGYGLPNLQRLIIQLNKIRLLPSSICEMKSLKYLDVHFNELRGFPQGIGKLTSLEVLNASNNFGDFTGLPETICDLTNLRELDLSNNQIRALPDGFGRLENLTKLNLEENPLVVPTLEITKKGAEAVKEFMKKRWINIVAERQQVEANRQQAQTGWFSWGRSLIGSVVYGVGGYLGGGQVGDPYLNQQL